MVDHLKVGAVDGPSEAVVKKAERVYIIIITAEEGRAPKRLQIHNLSDRPNTNIATPGIRISYHDLRRYFTVTFIRHWYEQSCQFYLLSPARDNCHDNAHAILHSCKLKRTILKFKQFQTNYESFASKKKQKAMVQLPHSGVKPLFVQPVPLWFSPYQALNTRWFCRTVSLGHFFN